MPPAIVISGGVEGRKKIIEKREQVFFLSMSLYMNSSTNGKSLY